MCSRNPVIFGRARLTWAGTADDGMHLELAAWESADPMLNPILSFREDEQSGQQVIIHLADKDVVLPPMDLKLAISEAELGVHKESFYDEPAADT